MILIIDNYDSFVYTLARYVTELGYTPSVLRNDKVSLAKARAMQPSHIIISPGPCTPKEAGISNQLIQQMGSTTPILGICLGHQCIGHVYGGTIHRAKKPIHGKVSAIHHTGTGVFKGLKNPLTATRYHSLVVEKEDIPNTLEITAKTKEEEIMALAHKTHPVVGVQFHPESVLTQQGHALLKNFLEGRYR